MLNCTASRQPLLTCFSALSMTTGTVLWPVCVSMMHSKQMTCWSVRQNTSRSLWWSGQVFSCSCARLGSVSRCRFPPCSSSWYKRCLWQYESRHSRQGLTALNLTPVQTPHSTSSGPAAAGAGATVFSLLSLSFSTTSANNPFLPRLGRGENIWRHWGQLHSPSWSTLSQQPVKVHIFFCHNDMR